MTSPLTAGNRIPGDRLADDPAGRQRPSTSKRPTSRGKFGSGVSPHPPAPSITKGTDQIEASWGSGHDHFDLVIRSHPAGLHLTLCTWLKSGAVLEECFAIHTLVDFEDWIAKAPTKFDHPVAHQEFRRFAHGKLST